MKVGYPKTSALLLTADVFPAERDVWFRSPLQNINVTIETCRNANERSRPNKNFTI